MICDSHAHLNHDDAFQDDREQVLLRAREAGVDCILNVATRPDDAAATVEIARRHPQVLAAVGIHPHEAALATPAALDDLERLSRDATVVAWGEIGLDYHYMNAPRDVQCAAFASQLQRAAARDLPVSVHNRDSDQDLLDLIQRHAGPRRGVIHCFTSDWAMAASCLDAGFYLSFSGILTFRNADGLRDVARRTPAHRLLVETDSPYLAPVPHRGARNEPARVVDVLERLAEVRGVSAGEMAAITSENFRTLFGQLTESSNSRAGG